MRPPIARVLLRISLIFSTCFAVFACGAQPATHSASRPAAALPPAVLCEERQLQVSGPEAQNFIDSLLMNHVNRDVRGPNLMHMAVDRVDCDLNPANQPDPSCTITYFGRDLNAAVGTTEQLYRLIADHGGSRSGPAPAEIRATAIGVDCTAVISGSSDSSFCTMIIVAN